MAAGGPHHNDHLIVELTDGLVPVLAIVLAFLQHRQRQASKQPPGMFEIQSVLAPVRYPLGWVIGDPHSRDLCTPKNGSVKALAPVMRNGPAVRRWSLYLLIQFAAFDLPAGGVRGERSPEAGQPAGAGAGEVRDRD